MKTSKDVQAVIYRKNKNILEFLLLKRFDADKKENHYRLVKGGVKNNESLENAIIREIKEEVGLENINLKNKLNSYSYKVGGVLHEVEVFLIENTKIEDINISSDDEGDFKIKGTKWLSKNKTIEMLEFEQEKNQLKNLSI